MNFGKDFYWGTATASYQIEGGRCEDGKSDSIWDTFAHKSGAIERGETGDVACDHYHRLDEDLDLLKELGGNAYRFSLSWSRILPNGTGKINEKGTDFYNRLIDGLLERNITPFMTLHHWDLPQVLQNRGGFLNREIADWFAEYAEVVKKLYGDRVKHYFTINEPQTLLGCGYREGVHAPGLALSLRELLLAMHNLLLAHGNAAKVLKTIPGSEVGYASCGMLYAPASDKKEDFEAAYERTFACRQDWRGKDPVGSISSYADPIFFGKYSDWWYEFPEEFRPEVTESDMKLISTPLDFFALNMYDGRFVRRCDDGNIEELPFKAGAQKTQMNWEVTPEVLYWAPLILQKRYKKKIYIGENGIACTDFVFLDGKIHDTYRQEYIKMHLRSLCRAANEKDSKIAGYFHWSFMDNFEWSFGYRPRFGLVHVDFETLKRTPKDSFYYYQDIIKTNGENL